MGGKDCRVRSRFLWKRGSTMLVAPVVPFVQLSTKVSRRRYLRYLMTFFQPDGSPLVCPPCPSDDASFPADWQALAMEQYRQTLNEDASQIMGEPLMQLVGPAFCLVDDPRGGRVSAQFEPLLLLVSSSPTKMINGREHVRHWALRDRGTFPEDLAMGPPDGVF